MTSSTNLPDSSFTGNPANSCYYCRHAETCSKCKQSFPKDQITYIDATPASAPGFMSVAIGYQVGICKPCFELHQQDLQQREKFWKDHETELRKEAEKLGKDFYIYRIERWNSLKLSKD